MALRVFAAGMCLAAGSVGFCRKKMKKKTIQISELKQGKQNSRRNNIAKTNQTSLTNGDRLLFASFF